MPLTDHSNTYFNNISNKLTFLTLKTRIENTVNLTNINIHAEQFYVEFLNRLFDLNFVNANAENQNAAGIDLIDKEKRIIVQVSGSFDHGKIQRSLDKSTPNYADYHFRFVAITETTTKYQPFTVPDGLTFDREKDVLNTPALLRCVLSAGIEKQKALSELMDKYFGSNPLPIKGQCLTEAPGYADTNSVICRETELEAITNMLQEKKSVLLMSGFGGIGKTALARLVFHTMRWNYDQVAWIPYRQNLKDSLLSNIRLEEDIRDMAVRWQEIEKILKNGLSKLIVIDNADRDEKSGQFPQDDVLLNTITGYRNVTVILTSRLEEIYNYAYYEVGFLSEDACVELFYKHYANDPERAQQDVVRDLAKLAKYHTLTVELIARGARRETDLQGYYNKLNKSFANAENKVRSGHNNKQDTIVAHLESLFNIKRRTRKEKQILFDFAVLPAGAALTPEEAALWFRHKPDIPDQLQQDGWLLWSEAGYAMHPLVKEIVLFKRLPRRTAKKFLAFVEVWNNGYFSYNDIHTERDRKLALAESVVDAVCREDTLQLAHIHDNMGTAYWQAGQYPQAEAHYLRAIAIKEAKLGKDHPHTATTYNNIALVYDDMGDLDKALKFYEKALAIKEAKLGKDHPDTAATYNNIALVYKAKGDLDKALEFYEKDMAISEAKLGKDHPSTATTYNNIALVYQAKGELDKALEFFEKALAISEAKLGKDHPDTAGTYNNIALVYKAKGDPGKALEFYEKALAIFEAKLGKDHPHTATTYTNIASVYYAKGDLDKALEFHEKALAIRETKLGKDHPSTATTYNNIAGVYKAKGDLDKALEFYEKALAIHEAKLGKDHPSTATTYTNIASVYYAKGDLDKALKFYEKAKAIHEAKLGEDHPDTATTYNNIAGVYKAKGDLDKALKFHEKALAIHETKLGKDHPDTAATYNNIAGVYKAKGDLNKALEFYEKALAIVKAKLGKDHPDTAGTYNNIALVYKAKGDPGKALEFYEKALAIFEAKLGKDHPHTATTYNNIGSLYFAKEDYATAKDYLLRALRIRLRKLGPGHPNVKATMGWLFACDAEEGGSPETFFPWLMAQLDEEDLMILAAHLQENHK